MPPSCLLTNLSPPCCPPLSTMLPSLLLADYHPPPLHYDAITGSPRIITFQED
uniref:Uncharacterized protein n=1 Tax=Oryza sativa subsp. japonica TaxID=39947 RepID=Q6K394_ORYSJ|nr:hypothetical protein [Oryza sativa Japonica Group]BAD20007.1 hypothetical protein [Oryza sativa Japonica Group]